MHTAEKLVFAIRHHRYLEDAQWIWNGVRPIYDKLLTRMGRGGLRRTINGSDAVLIAPRWRMIGEEYEPDVWRRLMSEVRPGDVVADVGAYVGLYTIALAKRVRPSGHVVAFEPDKQNCGFVREHLRLNEISASVSLIEAAVGEREGQVTFESNLESSFVTGSADGDSNLQSNQVRCVALDTVFKTGNLDLLKIDVEGYEERVLEGAKGLLKDRERGPRAVFIEMHPYAWPALNTTSDSILGLLGAYGYDVQDIAGNPVSCVETYCEVVAFRRPQEARSR